MARSKRHHHVPQTLQRRFQSRDRKIWFASREAKGEVFSRPEERNLESAFRERNFYTVRDDSGAATDRVERDFFGPIDSILGALLAEITRTLDAGLYPRFTEGASESFKHLIMTLKKRSKDQANEINDIRLGSEIHSGISEDAQRLGIPPHEVARYLQIATPKVLGRDVRVQFQASDNFDVVSNLEEYSIDFAAAPDRSAFVLGSRMVFRLSNDESSIKGVQLWFPASPKYCVVLHNLGWFGALTCLQSNKVREFNEYVVSSCLEVGSHSQKLISSLIRQRG